MFDLGLVRWGNWAPRAKHLLQRSAQVSAFLLALGLGLEGQQAIAVEQFPQRPSESQTQSVQSVQTVSGYPVSYEAIRLAIADAIPLPRSTGPRLKEGVHFYGEASTRDQLGSTYMVFEVQDGRAIGAVYWPQSSFSCFEGRFQGKTLALRVEDPYGDAPYRHELALEETAIVAANGLQSVEMKLGIEGMQALDSANEADLGFLATCKAPR